MNGSVVHAYSLAKDGNKNLTTNFKVREFACKDGSDPVFVSAGLVSVLQQIRSFFRKPVTITSGYRTPAHNAKEGGSAQSQHLYGMAADIVVEGVAPLVVAEYADSLLPGTGGIIVYPKRGFVHIDVRKQKYRATE